jgi:hypothetical protein
MGTWRCEAGAYIFLLLASSLLKIRCLPCLVCRDMLTSIRRYYSNAYTDEDKQAAINLLLGNFVPQAGRPQLWELGSDYYLHSGEHPFKL